MQRVLVFTDEPVLASGAAQVLMSAGKLEVLTVTAQDALFYRVGADSPDVLLLDFTPEITFETVGELVKAYPRCKIALWVRTASVEMTLQAFELGVRGIFAKALTPEAFAEGVRRLLDGETRLDLNPNANTPAVRRVPLTNREKQLVSLLCQGVKNKEIAQALSITEGTVKVYLSKLFQKAGVKDRFELALSGLRNAVNINTPAPAGTCAHFDPERVNWARALIVRQVA